MLNKIYILHFFNSKFLKTNCIEPICDTILILIQQSETIDIDSRCTLILQTSPFFHEVIDNLKNNSELIPKLRNSLSKFSKCVKNNITLFLSDETYCKQLADLLTYFINCPLQNEIAPEISWFVVAFLYSDYQKFPNSKIILPFLFSFFKNVSFSESFEMQGGIFVLWDIYKNEEKYAVSNFIEVNRQKYLQIADASKAAPVISYMVVSFEELPESTALPAIHFLFGLFMDQKCDLVSIFIEHGGLAEVNKYIINRKVETLVIAYQLFRPFYMLKGKNGDFPVFSSFIDLISSNEISSSTRIDALSILYSVLKEFSPDNMPIQVNDVFLIAIVAKTPQEVSLLTDIALYMAELLKCDASLLFPAVSKLFTVEIALSTNLSIFKFLKTCWQDLSAFGSLFLNNIIIVCKNDDFSKLLNKYDDLYECISLSLSSDAPIRDKQLILKHLFASGANISNKSLLMPIIYEGLLSDDLCITVITESVNLVGQHGVIEQIYEAVLNVIKKPFFRRKLIELRLVLLIEKIYNSKDLSEDTVLKILKGLSAGYFNLNLNNDVYKFFEITDIKNASKDKLQSLIFYENKNGTKNLVFPSLLYLCDNFTLETPFDIWLAGQYGIDIWLNKTGKTIDKFPDIDKVAMRFILPKHAKMVLSYPSLLESCCNSSFGMIPLFQFSDNFINTQLNIKIGTNINEESICFWFFFETYPLTNQIIFEINEKIISLKGETKSLYINEQELCPIKLNRWIHFAVTFNDKSILTIYIDGCPLSTLKSSIIDPVTIGSHKNNSQWYIGGSLRFFSAALTQNEIHDIFSYGVLTTAKCKRNENATITADTFIEHFGDKQNGKILSENTKLVPSFSLPMHIFQAYDGSNCIYKSVLDYIAADKKDDAISLIKVLCYLQKNEKSKWDLNTFALHISCLITIASDYFDSGLLNLIFSVFQIDSENFDWGALLTLILDPGLFNTENSSYVVSQLFGFIVQCPISNEKYLLDSLYMFSFIVLQMCDLSDENREAMNVFLSKLTPTVNTFIACFTSIVDMKNFVSLHSMEYKPIIKAPLYNYYSTKLRNYITGDFLHYFILREMEPDDSLNVLLIYASKAISQEEFSIDKHFIMRYCIEHCYNPISWSVALTVLTKTYISVIDNISFNIENIDYSLLPEFLIMVSVLYSSALTLQEGSFWILLLKSIMRQIMKIANNIPINDVNNRLVFSLSNFISCGLFAGKITFFPFMPQCTDANDVVSSSISNGQQFEYKEPVSCPIPTVTFFSVDDNITDIVYRGVKNIIPSKINLIPPMHNSYVPSSKFDLSKNTCHNVLDKNLKKVYSSWPSFITGIKNKINAGELPSIKMIQESQFLYDMIDFIEKILFKVSLQNEKRFEELLNAICLTNTHLEPKQSILIMQKLLSMLFEEMNNAVIYNEYLVSFACERIKEGWFVNNIVPLLSLMLTNIRIYKTIPIPAILLDTLLLCFDILNDNQMKIFMQTLISFSSIIFTPTNIQKEEFCRIIFFKCINCNEETAKRVIINLLEAMNSNEQIVSKWKEGFSISELCAVMGNNKEIDSFNKWVEENKVSYFDFLEKCKENSILFFNIEKEKIIKSLKNVSEIRSENSSKFYENADYFLKSIHIDTAASHSIFTMVKSFFRELYIFNCESFLRLRETCLTKHNWFEVNKNNMKTLSLLSDPLYPTKRLEESPAIYNIPEYPSGKTEECFVSVPEMTETCINWPIELRNMMFIPYKYYETISIHTEKQTLLHFSQSLPVSNELKLFILQAIYNNGKQFDYQSNISFLYGIEPLNGIILKSQNSFYFLAGYKYGKNSIYEELDEIDPLLFRFYISYMITRNFGMQSLYGGHPLIEWPFHDIIGVTRHLWLQRNCSLECVVITGWSFILISDKDNFTSLFKAITSVAEDTFQTMPPKSKCLSPINSLRLIKSGLNESTKQWQEGLIDNFTYLCLLNKFGLRSYSDFSQYFIMPWIISDYEQNSESIGELNRRDLSLPIGQIGETRKANFDQVYEDSDYEYYYGTHYMHFGVVLYFLFRIDPFSIFSMYLHKCWDHPNRIFFDMKEAWMAASEFSPSDVKEIIPQILTVPEIYKNINNLPLSPKENVTIGGWSSNERDFTDKMMALLNDDKTSDSLKYWIDLIFGFKQKGKEGANAKNLFHPLCYPSDESPLDSADEVERDAIATCIVNFGQCPVQLFKKNHPGRNAFTKQINIMSNPSHLIIQHLNSESFFFPITDLFIENGIIYTSNGISKVVPFKPEKVLLVYPINLGLHLCCQDNLKFCGSNMHNSKLLVDDASFFSPKCCCLSRDGLFFGIGQYESSATIFQLEYNKDNIIRSRTTCCFPTSGEVNSMCISSAHFIAACCCGSILEMYNIGTFRKLESVDLGFDITNFVIDDYLAVFICCGKEIAVVSISGSIIFKKSVESPITCVETTMLPSDSPNKFFLTGSSNGTVSFWKFANGESEIECIKSVKLSDKAITRISIDSTCQRVVCCTSADIFELSCVESTLKPLKRDYIKECSNCNAKGNQKLRVCSNCHRYVCEECARDIPGDQGPIKKIICNECFKQHPLDQ